MSQRAPTQNLYAINVELVSVAELICSRKKKRKYKLKDVYLCFELISLGEGMNSYFLALKHFSWIGFPVSCDVDVIIGIDRLNYVCLLASITTIIIFTNKWHRQMIRL